MTEFVNVSAVARGGADCGLAARREPVVGEHVRACLDRLDDGEWWDIADVLYYERPVTAGVLLGCLYEHPGCAVCAGPTVTEQVIAVVRWGPRLITASVGGKQAGIVHSALMGSLLHILLVSGLLPLLPGPGAMTTSLES